MDFSEASLILQRIPVLKSLSVANQKLLAFTSQLLSFEDGEMVFGIDEPARDVFVVVDGNVEQTVKNATGDVHAGGIGKNQLFGEMAVIQHAPRLVTVRAKGPVHVLRIEGAMFLQMVTDNPDAALAVMQELSHKISVLLVNQKKDPKVIK